MGYLLTQMWLCLLIAALIGGVIGWFLRGCCKEKIEALEANYKKRLSGLEREREDLAARAGDYEAVVRERDGLSDRVSRLQAVEQERDDLNARLAALDTSPTDTITTLTRPATGITSRNAEDEAIIASRAESTADVQSSYDIEEIEGIGAGYGKRLRGVDINTTTELLDKCHDSNALQNVAAGINMEPDVVHSWTCMADLMRVQGIGGQYAELLEFSDIHSVTALASADAEGLTVKMADVNAIEHRVREIPDVHTIKSWINRAASLPAKLSDEFVKWKFSSSDFATDTATISDVQISAAIDAQSSYEIEEIEGIGKGYGKKLRELDIATTADLLTKCPDAASMQPVIEAMNLENWVIRSWASMADLILVNGVGGQYAELLNFSDIQSVEALARANAAGLVAKMNKLNDKERRVEKVPNTETVTGWIEHAKTLPAMLRLGI